jgi:acyl-CoA synthetase (AMP-forming)/AMP-acid ligase II/acyl carrier protein
MHREEIRERLASLMKDVLQVESLDEHCQMAEVESWDSLNNLILIARIESEFNIVIQFEDFIEMISLEKIVDVISRYLKKMIRPDRSRLAPHQMIKRDIALDVPNVGLLFKSRARRSPSRVYLIEPDVEDRVFTYEEFLRWVEVWEGWFQAHSVHRGTRINLIITNSAGFVAVYFAALSRGLTVVPINPNLAPAEMVYIIKDCGSELVLYEASLAKKVEQVQQTLGTDLLFVDHEVVGSTSSNQERGDEGLPPARLEDEAVIIYTSGTTGNPKGVVLNHLNLLADAKAIAEWFQFNEDTRTLCILPMFHNNGQVVTLLAPLYVGGSTIMTKGQTALGPFWDIVKEHQATWTSVMPSILSILLQFRRSHEGSTLQGIICGGQVLKRSVQEAFEATHGVPVFEGFGLTETTSFACFNNAQPEKRVIGVVGRPLPINEMAILDIEGRPLGPGVEGEICVRGYNVACEYLGLPERNRQAFAHGWFHSGDYGYRDEEGYYHFLCRHDDLIIKGGENIYPAEIENLLLKHPSVVDCAAIGVPHPLLGEDICAFVLLQNESTTEKELREFCSGRIAYFKQPQKIVIVNRIEGMNQIPKGPTQKILYRILKEYYQDHLLNH